MSHYDAQLSAVAARKPRNMTKQYVLLVGLLGLAIACAPEVRTPEEIQAVQDYQSTFACDGNLSVHLRFSPGNAVLDSRGVSVAMIQQPAAKGYRYTGSGQSLSQQGYDLTWTDSKGVVHHCQDVKAPSPNGDSISR